MLLSNRSKRPLVFDEVRQIWVSATKEEIVRQHLLQKMIREHGFPKHMLLVEKALSEMPHLQDKKKELPDRRVDIVCFRKKENGTFSPLLVIECKQTNLTKSAFLQILGYNHYLEAPFIALASEHGFLFRYVKNDVEFFLDNLPSYQTLLEMVTNADNISIS